VDQQKPSPKHSDQPLEGELAQNPAVDEFLQRLNYGMRRPKPGQEAVAAALEVIQRLAVEMDSEDSALSSHEGANTCISCGTENREGNRFCSSCGVSLQMVQAATQPTDVARPVSVQPDVESSGPALPPGSHHYHHHYHHHYFPNGAAMNGAADGAQALRNPATVRVPLSGHALSRAEAAVRKLSQDWAQACNTKHLDDLIELYVPDAVVLRPNVPVVRGTAAIREFFFTVLDSGFGEVEMEPLRVEIYGEVAYEAGRCKSLVPVAMGKRREERGKYLVISTRHNGEWKITADSWSSDLSLAEPVPSPAKPARKTP
jgi:uncharacterized protein (TIGR02246 family)